MAPYDTYFAASPATVIGEKLVARVEDDGKHTITAQIRAWQSWAFKYYFGFDGSGIHASSGVQRGGEQGELAKIRVNQSRALVNTLRNLIVGPNFVWTPKATNRDADSIKETLLASAVLEYYWTDKAAAKYATQAIEHAIVFTEGFVFTPWDPEAGEDVGLSAPNDAFAPAPAAPEAPPSEDAAPAAPAPAPTTPDQALAQAKVQKSGDVRFFNPLPWDVIRDPGKGSWEALDWIIVRMWENRFDVAARYPDKAIEVVQLPYEQKALRAQPSLNATAPSDDIPVYYFYHKRTPALPQGRQTIFLASELVLDDRALRYETAPLHRVAPDEFTGTPYGYSVFLECLGVQELMDSLHTIIASNISAFGVQCIAIEEGSQAPIEELANGLRAVYYPPGKQPPSALQLTKSPPEVFPYLDTLARLQELNFGLNAVVRGSLPGNPKDISGSALSLLESQALRQSSTLQKGYYSLLSAAGDSVIKTLRQNLTSDRAISIVGKQNKYLVRDQTYTGTSFGRISKVTVDVGNPSTQSAAGREQLAEKYIQMGAVKNPEQLDQVLSTGRLDPLTHGVQDELLLIVGENEQLSNGQNPPVMIHDDHLTHCREHRSETASSNSRTDPGVLQAATQHIHDHYTQYYGTPPMMPGFPDPMTGMPGPPQQDPLYRPRMLFLMGMQPPPPALEQLAQPPPGMAPPLGPPGTPPKLGTPAGPPSQSAGNPNAGAPPKPPEPPIRPGTGQRWNPIDGGGVVPLGNA